MARREQRRRRKSGIMPFNGESLIDQLSLFLAALPNSAEQGLLSLAKLDRAERRFCLSTLNEIRQRPMMQEQMDKNWPQTELGCKLGEF